MTRKLTKARLREAQLGIQQAYVHRNHLVLRAYQEGWSDQQIAEAMGLSRMMIWKIRHPKEQM